MKNLQVPIVLLIVAGIVIYFLAMDNKRKEEQIEKLLREIKGQKQLSENVRKMLMDLIKQNQTVDPKLADELTQIISLLYINQSTTALMKLAKVIENLLKELYQKDEEFNTKLKGAKKRKPVFADYLEHAREKGVVSAEDYHLLAVLKGIRNEEAHENGVRKEVTRMAAAFVAGVGTVISLCQLLKRDTFGGADMPII